MKNWNTSFFAAIFVLALSLLGTTTARAYSDLVVLGDSLSDVGNLFIATSNSLPQDPPYFQGRFSNGPSFTEHLYQSLGLPGVLTPAFAGGTNYAVGGARTRYHAFDNDPATVFDPSFFDPLTDISSFENPVAPFTLRAQAGNLLFNSGNTLDSQALYSVWIGSNDVADAFRSVLLAGGDDTYALNLLAQSAVDLGGVIKAIADAGARHLLIPTVPNLGLVPQVQALLPNLASAEAIASGLSLAFNSLVDAQLASITAKITRLETFTFLTDLVADPSSFGLPVSANVSDSCFTGFVGVTGDLCPNPQEYVFFDNIHPSSRTHELLGALAANAVPAPSATALMVLGLVGIGYQRRRNRIKAV